MPNKKTYSKRKHGEQLIVPFSQNFKVKEMASKDGADKIIIDREMFYPIQKIRNMYGPVTINSGYRTSSHNKAVGGASSSMHLKGQAADIKINGKSPLEVASLAYALGFKRIIIYSNFVHIDTKENSTYLHNEVANCNAIFNKVEIPYAGTLLKNGVKSLEVGLVQFKLNKNGYNCGTVDGIAGVKFDTAVKKFQKAKGLLVDGKVGKNTWNALFNK